MPPEKAYLKWITIDSQRVWSTCSVPGVQKIFTGYFGYIYWMENENISAGVYLVMIGIWILEKISDRNLVRFHSPYLFAIYVSVFFKVMSTHYHLIEIESE